MITHKKDHKHFDIDYSEDTKNKLDPYNFAFIQEVEFLEFIYDKIDHLFKDLVLQIVVYVIEQNKKVEYHKKYIVFNMAIYDDPAFRFHHKGNIYDIFYHFLKQELDHRLDLSVGPTRWHFLPPDMNYRRFIGSYLKVERKTLLSNMSSPPVFIEKQPTLNKINRRLHFTVRDTKDISLKQRQPPDCILHIDICSDSTTIVYEYIDTSNGRITGQFELDLE